MRRDEPARRRRDEEQHNEEHQKPVNYDTEEESDTIEDEWEKKKDEGKSTIMRRRLTHQSQHSKFKDLSEQGLDRGNNTRKRKIKQVQTRVC